MFIQICNSCKIGTLFFKRGDIMKINSILKQDFHTIHANDSIDKALPGTFPR